MSSLTPLLRLAVCLALHQMMASCQQVNFGLRGLQRLRAPFRKRTRRQSETICWKASSGGTLPSMTCSFPKPAASVPALWAGCGLRAGLSLCRAPPIVRVQLGECLKLIAYTDHPELWPGLLPLVVQNLNTQASVALQTLWRCLARCCNRRRSAKQGWRSQSELGAVQDHSRIYGCLFALRILARKYEFRDSGERVPLEQVVEATFPAVLQLVQVASLQATQQRQRCNHAHAHVCCHCIARQSAEARLSPGGPCVQQLLASKGTSLEVAELLKLAFKTFWSAMYMGVPKVMLQQDQFVGWMTCLHTLLTRPVPQATPACPITACCPCPTSASTAASGCSAETTALLSTCGPGTFETVST